MSDSLVSDTHHHARTTMHHLTDNAQTHHDIHQLGNLYVNLYIYGTQGPSTLCSPNTQLTTAHTPHSILMHSTEILMAWHKHIQHTTRCAMSLARASALSFVAGSCGLPPRAGGARGAAASASAAVTACSGHSAPASQICAPAAHLWVHGCGRERVASDQMCDCDGRVMHTVLVTRACAVETQRVALAAARSGQSVACIYGWRSHR